MVIGVEYLAHGAHESQGEATMRTAIRVLAQIAGGVVGLLVGGVLVFLVFAFIMNAVAGPVSTGDMTTGSFVVVFFGPPAALVGAIIGAALGATVVGKALRQRSSFSSGMNGVVSPGDTLEQQLGQPKCPFCHSTTFRVAEEAGARRCSNCHSVLPNYIQGNR